MFNNRKIKKRENVVRKEFFNRNGTHKDTVVLVALYNQHSFAIRTLHSVLVDKGQSVQSIFFKNRKINKCFDPPTGKEIDILLQWIGERNPSLVGISVNSTFFKLAAHITDRIKKEIGSTVVWGGAHPTVKPAHCLEHADIVCRGEGEGAIVDLLSALHGEVLMETIPNLWVKNNGTIVKNEVRPLLQDLDSLPLTDYLYKDMYYLDKGFVVSQKQNQKLRLEHAVTVMTSRGCHFECSYCNNSAFYKLYKDKGTIVRRRSVYNVIEELLRAKQAMKKLECVFFIDDVFTFDHAWIREFCVQYKKHIDLPFWCYYQPQCSSEVLIPLLKNAGLVSVSIGISHGSERIRKEYFNRHDTNREIIDAAQDLYRNNISCAYDIIFDNDLFENDGDRRNALEFLLQLPRPFRLYFFNLIHFSGTQLTNRLLAEGTIAASDVEDKRCELYKHRYKAMFSSRKDKEKMFWELMYYMCGNRFIPRKFIMWLHTQDYARKHLHLLSHIFHFFCPSDVGIENDSKLDYARGTIMRILCGVFVARRKVLRYLSE
ncbi:MAG: radical SAM protein [Candidatus Omnitrophota bacterium]